MKKLISRLTVIHISLILIIFADNTTHNFDVITASYLGGSGEDIPCGIVIAPDNSIYIAGIFPGENFGLSPVELLGGGDGAVIHLNEDGTEIISITRMGSKISGIDIHPQSGEIAVAGSFGVAVLQSGGTSLKWNENPGTGRRVSIGDDGTVAVMAKGDDSRKFDRYTGTSAYVYNADGIEQGSWGISGRYDADILVDSEREQVITTGFNTTSLNYCLNCNYGGTRPHCETNRNQNVSSGCKRWPIQIASVRSHSYNGADKWTAYGWHPDLLGYHTGKGEADSRGRRLGLGEDGYLYFAAGVHGGDNIFRFESTNIDNSADNFSDDKYNTPSGGGQYVTYLARLEPENGDHVKGTYLISRKQDNKFNVHATAGITADQNGNVHLVGYTGGYIEDRSQKKLNNKPVDEYTPGQEAFYARLSPDLENRDYWHVFSKGGDPSNYADKSMSTGIALKGNRLAICAWLYHNDIRMVVSENALDQAHNGSNEAWYAVKSFSDMQTSISSGENISRSLSGTQMSHMSGTYRFIMPDDGQYEIRILNPAGRVMLHKVVTSGQESYVDIKNSWTGIVIFEISAVDRNEKYQSAIFSDLR